VEEREPGVWVIRTATVIPDNERWLHEPSAAADLQAAMAWSVSHGPADAGLQDTLNKIRKLTWNQLYRDQGIQWEKIKSIKPPAGSVLCC